MSATIFQWTMIGLLSISILLLSIIGWSLFSLLKQLLTNQILKLEPNESINDRIVYELDEIKMMTHRIFENQEQMTSRVGHWFEETYQLMRASTHLLERIEDNSSFLKDAVRDNCSETVFDLNKFLLSLKSTSESE